MQHVFDNPIGRGVSRSSGEPIVFGFTQDGRYIACVYEDLGDGSAYPITAYEVQGPQR